jgi:NAD(P)-dependent dehydrogenase (short-subunit alcohol dehydrogenase family)
MITLAGHNALITGSTKGVGQAIACAMAEAGANVVIHGRQMSDAAQQTLDRCRQAGVQAEFITGDLSADTATAVEDVFQQAMAANPDIDILVNNAGTYIDQPFLEMDLETFDKTMKLNVYSCFFLTQRFARQWVPAEVNGRVLFIGSINGRLAEEVHAAYDSSKGAVEAMVKSLCVSLAPHNIRVNGLAPGLVYTPLTAPALDQPEFMKWMQLHTPNGQVPGPEVCGDGAVYLCSDAAVHVHGQMLLVDGGMSIWQQPDLPATD